MCGAFTKQRESDYLVPPCSSCCPTWCPPCRPCRPSTDDRRAAARQLARVRLDLAGSAGVPGALAVTAGPLCSRERTTKQHRGRSELSRSANSVRVIHSRLRPSNQSSITMMGRRSQKGAPSRQSFKTSELISGKHFSISRANTFKISFPFNSNRLVPRNTVPG